MLAWYPPILSDVEDLHGLRDNDEIEPDEDLATRTFEVLVSNWPEAGDRPYEQLAREPQPQKAAMSR